MSIFNYVAVVWILVFLIVLFSYGIQRVMARWGGGATEPPKVGKTGLSKLGLATSAFMMIGGVGFVILAVQNFPPPIANSTGYTCSEIQASSEKASKGDEYLEKKLNMRLYDNENENQVLFDSTDKKSNKSYDLEDTYGAADSVCANAKPEDSVDDLLDDLVDSWEPKTQDGGAKTTEIKTESSTPEPEPVTPEEAIAESVRERQQQLGERQQGIQDDLKKLLEGG